MTDEQCREAFEKWNDTIDDHDNFRDALWAAWQAAWNAAPQVEKLVEALEFYAVEFNYRRNKGVLKNCPKSWSNPSVVKDNGKRARQALAGHDNHVKPEGE